MLYLNYKKTLLKVLRLKRRYRILIISVSLLNLMFLFGMHVYVNSERCRHFLKKKRANRMLLHHFWCSNIWLNTANKLIYEPFAHK